MASSYALQLGLTGRAELAKDNSDNSSIFAHSTCQHHSHRKEGPMQSEQPARGPEGSGGNKAITTPTIVLNFIVQPPPPTLHLTSGVLGPGFAPQPPPPAPPVTAPVLFALNCKPFHRAVITEIQDNRLKMVMLDEIRQFLDTKWQSFGTRVWVVNVSMSTGLMVFWAAALGIGDHWRLDSQNLSNHTTKNVFIITCEVLAWLNVTFRLLSATKGILCHRTRYFVGVNRRVCVPHFFECFVCGMYVSSWIARAAGSLETEDALAACGQCIGWFGVLLLLVATHFLGPFVLMVKDMIRNDLLTFLAALVLGFAAFYMSVCILGASEVTDANAYREILDEMLRPLVGGDVQFEHFVGRWAWAQVTLVVFYLIFSIIIFLNLLIAMMNTTYSLLAANQKARWYMERANMMMFFETEFSRSEVPHSTSNTPPPPTPPHSIPIPVSIPPRVLNGVCSSV